jgi:LAO/AO transport system kinase
VLLLSPGTGDDLQGVKRGIVELADVVVVNKADGDLAAAAERSAADYASALHLLRPRTEGWEVRVERVSSLLGEGIDRVWAIVEEHQAAMRASGVLDARRADQARDWMWSEVNDGLLDALASDPAVAAEMHALENDVRSGTVSPTAAAQRILRRFLS